MRKWNSCKYTFFVMVPLVASCGDFGKWHENVVLDVNNGKNQLTVLMRDLESGKERFFKANLNSREYLTYRGMINAGDTVGVRYISQRDVLYMNSRILSTPSWQLQVKKSCLEQNKFNQEYEKFKSLKQQKTK